MTIKFETQNVMQGKSPASIQIEAAVSRGPSRPMKIERLQMEGPREDEVLVRLVASGICHTDIGMRQSGGANPVVHGHEGAGVVERVGKAVHGVRRGDHVVLSYQSCGRCRACKRGRPTQCDHFWELNFGFSRLDGSNALESSGVRGHFFGQSSFATHALATERNVVKVSKALPLEMLAPLGCGLQTGAATVMNSLAVRSRASIAIFGTGSVGLAALMAARVAGADPIIAVDIRPKTAATSEGTWSEASCRRSALRSRQEDRRAYRRHRLRVETTGDPTIELAARNLLNPCGRLALLTGCGSSEELPGDRHVLSVIQGDAIPKQFIPRMIELWCQGRFPVRSAGALLRVPPDQPRYRRCDSRQRRSNLCCASPLARFASVYCAPKDQRRTGHLPRPGACCNASGQYCFPARNSLNFHARSGATVLGNRMLG